MKKVVVAEPVHRVAPRAISSGISFRELPPVSFIELKKVACFYQAKAKQLQPDTNSKYGRYLIDAMDEILVLCEALENKHGAQVNALQQKIDHMKLVLEEWEEYFGCNLDKLLSTSSSMCGQDMLLQRRLSVLSPKQLYAELLAKDDTIKAMQEQLKLERIKHTEVELEMNKQSQLLKDELNELKTLFPNRINVCSNYQIIYNNCS